MKVRTLCKEDSKNSNATLNKFTLKTVQEYAIKNALETKLIRLHLPPGK